jgi:hypothetical protein
MRQARMNHARLTGNLPGQMTLFFFAVFLIVAEMRGTAEETLTGEAGKQYVLMLYDGFHKNREAFQAFTCKFTAACGSVDCPEQWWQKETWDAEISSVDQTAQGFLARDGKVFRYHIVADEGRHLILGAAENNSSDRAPVRVAVVSCLTASTNDTLFDDKYVIQDLPIGPQAIMSPIEDWPQFRINIVSPWHPNITFLPMEPYLDALRNLVTMSQNSFATVKKDPGAGATIVSHPFVGGGVEYHVDERRGYMPVKMVRTQTMSGIETMEVLFTEVSQIKGFGWFPMKWTKVSAQRSQSQVKGTVVQLSVSDLKMGRPDREVITLKISKGRHLIDQKNIDRLDAIVMQEDTVVTANDIPKLLDRYYNPSKYVESARRGPRLSLWPRVVLVVLGAIAVLGIAYIGYRRWRSARE